eukprot:scaffold2859_cov349-Pavlova_lutheri.AAC.30
MVRPWRRWTECMRARSIRRKTLRGWTVFGPRFLLSFCGPRWEGIEGKVQGKGTMVVPPMVDTSRLGARDADVDAIGTSTPRAFVPWHRGVRISNPSGRMDAMGGACCSSTIHRNVQHPSQGRGRAVRLVSIEPPFETWVRGYRIARSSHTFASENLPMLTQARAPRCPSRVSSRNDPRTAPTTSPCAGGRLHTRSSTQRTFSATSCDVLRIHPSSKALLSSPWTRRALPSSSEGDLPPLSLSPPPEVKSVFRNRSVRVWRVPVSVNHGLSRAAPSSHHFSRFVLRVLRVLRSPARHERHVWADQARERP